MADADRTGPKRRTDAAERRAGNRDRRAPAKKAGEESKKENDKELKKWLKRMEQRALAGGLLHGPGLEGSSGLELTDLLHSNPELAVRVREWIQAQRDAPGPLPGMAGAGGLQTQLFQAFPELYQQYVAATGKSIIYDAEGNPVRLVDPSRHFGLREGDELVTPTLYSATGEALPLPEIQYGPRLSGRETTPGDNDALGFGAIPAEGLGQENPQQEFYGDVFDIEDLAGGEQ